MKGWYPTKIYLSIPLFPFIRGEVLPATSSPPHLIVFSPLLCLMSSSSSLLSCLPPISALVSLVSCPAHVTLPVSSVVCHPPSFLRVLPTVVCSSPVSLSSSSALPSLPLMPPFFSCLLSLLLLFFVPSCFRTLAAFCCCISVCAKVSVPYRCDTSAHDAGPPSPSQLPSMRSHRPALFDVPLSPSSRLRTLPLLGTRNCPPESFSSPPARCPALPSGCLCVALPSSLGYVSARVCSGKQTVPLRQ